MAFAPGVQLGRGVKSSSACEILNRMTYSAFQIGLVLPWVVVVLLRALMQEDRCVPIRWICESGRYSTAMPG